MIVNHLTRALLLVALYGMSREGLQRRCWTFFGYLLSVLLCGSLMAYWPDVFHNFRFYASTRDLYAALKVLVAIELGVGTLAAFPGALRRERGLTLLVLLGLLALVLTISPSGPEPYLEWRRRLNVGTLWLFASWALLVAYYRLPLDRWRAALLAGFTFQLLVQTVLLAHWKSYVLSLALDPLVACWWIYSAFRPLPIPERFHVIEHAPVARTAF